MDQQVNQIRKGSTLSNVVMPLVRLMTESELSWADREQISKAVQTCCCHWESLESERMQYASQATAGQSSQYGNAIPAANHEGVRQATRADFQNTPQYPQHRID